MTEGEAEIAKGLNEAFADNDAESSEWEKEFDEKFVVDELAGEGEPLQIKSERLIADYIDGRLLRAEDIKSFIKQTLVSQASKMYEEVEKAKTTGFWVGSVNPGNDQTEGFNAGLARALEIITKYR